MFLGSMKKRRSTTAPLLLREVERLFFALAVLAALAVLSAQGAPPRADAVSAADVRDISVFDRDIFCGDASAGSSAKYCTRVFHERGDVTKETVAMVAERDARDAAMKACATAFERGDLLAPSASRDDSEGAKHRAKAASDDTARMLCEQMSR